MIAINEAQLRVWEQQPEALLSSLTAVSSASA
jgi:hypothetical protein